MNRLAGAIDLKEADEKTGNVGSAPWLRSQTEGRRLGLDFYHVAENKLHAHAVCDFLRQAECRGPIVLALAPSNTNAKANGRDGILLN